MTSAEAIRAERERRSAMWEAVQEESERVVI